MVQYKVLGVIACEPPRMVGQVARTIAERAHYDSFKIRRSEDDIGTIGYQVYVGEKPAVDHANIREYTSEDGYHIMTIIPISPEPEEGKHRESEPDERKKKYRNFAVEVTPLGEKKATKDLLIEVQAELAGKET